MCCCIMLKLICSLPEVGGQTAVATCSSSKAASVVRNSITLIAQSEKFQLTQQKSNDSVCTVATCYQYMYCKC